ncbi:hypothetical protein [Tahibacter sp.]|uniref:hypothetical protein n=1 Tax=Tahibacter sp. TaxID=2056211 RepID=UPI0028C3E75C|nr:hypothetical protein [Tahibacter sp.]
MQRDLSWKVGLQWAVREKAPVLCVHCDEAWLDRSEWRLLDRLALADKLTLVFTQPWQNLVRSTEAERRAEQLWIERLGDDYVRAQVIREWLRSATQVREILA